ncbi:urease accessory protein D isoform X1 [Cajanus cajan]|nr:urease accessory protein D isoform X1 [Cajanus cajan]
MSFNVSHEALSSVEGRRSIMQSGEGDKEMEVGSVVVEKVGGRSSVIRCFSRYPLKFIIPKKVGSSKIDAVWVYALNYGGGIVSGDHITCKFSVGDACTMVLTTQGSTKVYKSVGSMCSQQILEARVGSNALLAIIPDPVTCFSTARYYQKQVFSVSSDSNMVMVDWITSGRHESGEKWDFDLYRSTNNIFLEDGQPLFLDTMLLEKEKVGCIQEHMHNYQVIAMIVLLGPKMEYIQNLVQDHVKKIMSEQLQHPSTAWSHQRDKADHFITKPSFIASCSAFGPKKIGLLVRVAAETTESVYKFLRHQLAPLEPMIGTPPYK